MGFVYLALALALVTSGAAAVIDWRTGHIPNWLTLGSIGLAVVVHGLHGAAVGGFRGAASALVSVVLGIVVCSLVPLVLYRANGIGGGDVKMLAAIGAVCGPMMGLEAQFYSFIALVLYASGRLAYQGKLVRTLGNALWVAINPFLPAARRKPLAPELMTSFRFGPAILAGVVATALARWRVG
ncbi:MAG TPA: A24 family peptidase [Polyangiaceae bacterium]